MNDAASFVKAIIAGNWDAAAVFADWLDEHGDPRGKLLRRRWKRWQKEKQAEHSPAALASKRDADLRWERSRAARLESLGADFCRRLDQERASGESNTDYAFRNYVKRKFFDEWCDATADEFVNSQAYRDS